MKLSTRPPDPRDHKCTLVSDVVFWVSVIFLFSGSARTNE